MVSTLDADGLHDNRVWRDANVNNKEERYHSRTRRAEKASKIDVTNSNDTNQSLFEQRRRVVGAHLLLSRGLTEKCSSERTRGTIS